MSVSVLSISNIISVSAVFGCRIGDFLVGINGVDVEDCMTTSYSVADFSAMMKVAQRPLTLNINHIKKAAAKPRAPVAPAPKQKTSNPMIPVFIMFAILCAVIIGIWHDDHPIVAGNAKAAGGAQFGSLVDGTFVGKHAVSEAKAALAAACARAGGSPSDCS